MRTIISTFIFVSDVCLGSAASVHADSPKGRGVEEFIADLSEDVAYKRSRR